MKKLNISSKDLYLRLLGYVKPYWKTFAVGIFFMVVLALTEAGIPALLKPMLDGTFVEKDPTYLVWAPLGLIGLFLVRGFSSIINQFAFSDVSTKMVNDIRQEMFSHLIHLPTRFYDHHSTGNIISKITYDANAVTVAAIQVLTIAVKDSVTVVALISYIFWLDWQLALLIFILIPIVVFVAIILGKRMRILSRELQQAMGTMTHILGESLHAHKAVKIFGSHQYESSRFNEIANRVRRLQIKLFLSGSISVPIVEIIGACILASVMYIGTSRAVEDQLSVGGFVAFFAALGLIFSPIKRITKINEPLQRGLAAAESIFGILAEQPEVEAGKQIIKNIRGELSFRNLNFNYHESNTHTLKNINLDIPAGKTVAFVGTSGSGKSTLISLIPRLYNATSGQIYLDGVNTQDLTLKNLREHISLVSQDITLFNTSISENIAYGISPKPSVEEIIDAAKGAFANEFIEALPKGYSTEIGENGVRLSGGQRQRIAIARALLKDAHILILDEATSALDTESERYIKAAIEKLRKGRTTLIIAHRLSTIEHADNIAVMAQGEIVEFGNHNDLLKRGGKYSSLYQNTLADQK